MPFVLGGGGRVECTALDGRIDHGQCRSPRKSRKFHVAKQESGAARSSNPPGFRSRDGRTAGVTRTFARGHSNEIETGQPTVTTAPGRHIASAATFIKERLKSGAYGMSCKGSDGTPRFSDAKGHVFVGFFISEALTGLLDEVERTILLTRILSEEADGAWGFSPAAPFVSDEHEVFLVDSDDTAYVLRTLRRLGATRRPAGLLRFHRPEHMFVTFNSKEKPALAVIRSPENNLLAHVEVNANVFRALQGTNFEHLVNYELLIQAQRADGSWPSYFYPSAYFGTLLAVEVLSTQPWAAVHVSKALEFVLKTQNTDGSWGRPGEAYETALALSTLLAGTHGEPAVSRGVDFLLASLRSDGSWAGSQCIWEFQADSRDLWRAYDPHRTFTSAVCLTALRRAVGELPPVG